MVYEKRTYTTVCELLNALRSYLETHSDGLLNRLVHSKTVSNGDETVKSMSDEYEDTVD